MSDVKSKFTLHKDHIFKTSQTEGEIPIEVLSPHLVSSCGCLFSIIGILVAVSFGLFMGVFALIMVVRDQQYAREGQPVTAVVTSCFMEKEGKSGQRPAILYTYTVADVVYKGRDRMEGNCNDYPVGMTLDAIYLAAELSMSRIAQANITERGTEALLGTGGLMCTGVFMLGFAWFALGQVRHYMYARWYRRSLAASSTLLEGEITAINGHKPYKHDAYYVRVWYTFETPHKKILKGFAEAHRQDLKDKELPPVGTPVTVLYADNGAHMML